MAIYIGNSGSVGGTGALTVDNDHIFTNATERDAYFVSNPSELVEDLYVSTGGTLEKYVGSSWVDMSALIKGSTGATGADGESAYEVAVDNGFVGTEAEWLESLKGAGVENAMTTPIYDPQGIASDVFDRSNQTGTQAISTVTGLQTDLDSRALESDLTTLEGTVSTLSGVVASKADQMDLDVLDTEVDSLTLTVGNKLDSSEYTATDIKSKYESNVNTNAFTDAEKTKLAAIVDGGGSNVQSDWDATSGDAEILNKPTLGTMSTVDDSPSDGTAYIREDGSWVLCDISKVNGLQAELSSLEQGTTDLTTVVGTKASDADLTVVEGNVTTLTASVSAKLDSTEYTALDVKTKYESNLDTNAFTDAYETKLNNLTDRFKGVFADAITRDASVLTPANGDYCKQEDTGSFWFYGLGVWVDTGSSSTGDMIASIYDPQGIAQDTFDRSNHTGTQAISTVTGLQADLDTRALESDLTLVENDVSALSTSVSGKLDAVNYTSADVKTKYESNLDTNAFTDAEQTKLAGIENGAEANVGEEYTLTEKTKLGLIESGAQVNVGEEYTLAEKTKLATVSTGAQVNTVVAGSNITVDNTDPLHPVINSTATAGAEWGSITGTLSAQADLAAELATKQDGNTVLDNTTASFTTELATELSTLVTDVSDLNTEITLKASEADLTLVEDDVTSLTTTVGTKADQSDMDDALKAYTYGFGNRLTVENSMPTGYPESNAVNITQVYRNSVIDDTVNAWSASAHFAVQDVWVRLRANSTSKAWVGGGASSKGTGWTAELYHSKNIDTARTDLGLLGSTVGIGFNAGLTNQGNNSVAIGLEAGRYSQSTNSVAIGAFAGNTDQKSDSVVIGRFAGQYSAGSGSVAIGYLAGQGSNGVSGVHNYSTALGYSSVTTGTNQVQLGSSSATVYAQTALVTRSDERDKTDIQDTELGYDFIMKINPVQYRMNNRMDYVDVIESEDEEGNITHETVVNEQDGSRAGTRFHQGVIAQQVKEVMDELDVDFAGYKDASFDGGDDVKSIAYTEFIGPIIATLQTMDKTIKEQAVLIEELQSKL